MCCFIGIQPLFFRMNSSRLDCEGTKLNFKTGGCVCSQTSAGPSQLFDWVCYDRGAEVRSDGCGAVVTHITGERKEISIYDGTCGEPLAFMSFENQQKSSLKLQQRLALY